MDQEDRLVWNRVVARRRQECASLDKLVALQFLSSLPVDAPEGSPSEQLEFALQNAYDIASDPKATVKERRVAFEAIQRLRKSLNDSLAQHKKLITARVTTTTRPSLTTARATTTATAATTTTSTTTATTSNTKDRPHLGVAPQVPAPASVPPVATPRAVDTSANVSEPSRPTVSQDAAVSISSPLPTGTKGPGKDTASNARSPMVAGANQKANSNSKVTDSGASTSATDSNRTTQTSMSSKNAGNRGSTTQAKSNTQSEKIASTTPTSTSPMRSPPTDTGGRSTILATQNGSSSLRSPQPAPAARTTVASQSTTESATSATRATDKAVPAGTQTSTSTRTLSTQNSTTGTSKPDKNTPTSVVPPSTTGTGAESWRLPAQTTTASPSTGSVTKTATSVSRAAPASWMLPTTQAIAAKSGTTGSRSTPSAPSPATAARSTSLSTQTSTAANSGRTAPATNHTTATKAANGPGKWNLTNQTASASTSTSGVGRASPAAPQPATGSASGTWGQTQKTATADTVNLGKAASTTQQTATGAGSWSLPRQTATSGTGTIGRTPSTATQTMMGSGSWTIPTKASTASTSHAGRTTTATHQPTTGAGSWVLPTQTTGTTNGVNNAGSVSQTAPASRQTSTAGSTGRNAPSVSLATSGASSTDRVTPQSSADNHAGPGGKSASISADRSSGHTGVSQPNTHSLVNRNRSITADLVAAATTTAQVAADSLSDGLPAPNTKTKPPVQPTPAVAPPVYQQRSDSVVAIEKEKAKRTDKSGQASSTEVAPSILPPFEPPRSSKKRPLPDASTTDGTNTAAKNDALLNKDLNQLPAGDSSAQEPPQKNARLQQSCAFPTMEPTTQIAKSQTVVDFPPDTKIQSDSRYSYAQTDRPAVRIYFHRHWPTYEMLRGAGRLFEIWEPYWQVEKVVASGVTAPVEKIEWKAKPTTTKKDVTNIPRTVALFDVPALSSTDSSKISWGTLKAQSTSKPKDGDCTLLLRMLPIKRKPDENKKRANTHIWPIGTFLMINNTPTSIAQRKQASHDPSKWEYLSHPLELSYHIKNPKDQVSISMCCQDSTQFFYMVSVCSYKSPLTLKDRLLEPTNSFLHSLSMTESAKKAMEYINKNSMISIDDDDGAPNDDTGILIFSLVDPVTKVLMKTPVRGQKCKHWQCFDLQSFMEVNAPVSGGRWRCVCCEQFVNYQDLEVCGLTKEALVRFADVASATRDRVEFRADQTMTLLPAAKARYNNKRRQQSGSSAPSKPPVKNQQSAIPDPIEIIDLD